MGDGLLSPDRTIARTRVRNEKLVVSKWANVGGRHTRWRIPRCRPAGSARVSRWASSSSIPAAPATSGPSPSPAGNRLAAVAFVASLLFGLVVAPLTLPLSFVAHRQAVDAGQGASGLAKASMVISGIYLVLGAVVMALYVYRTHIGAGR